MRMDEMKSLPSINKLPDELLLRVFKLTTTNFFSREWK